MLCSQGGPGTSYFPLFFPLHWNLCRQLSDNGGSRISQTDGHQPQSGSAKPLFWELLVPGALGYAVSGLTSACYPEHHHLA